MKTFKGIDVSSYQGNINWDKVKPNIDFAIIRCGWGSDYKKQDDSKFARNVQECIRLNIPYGVYLYSYADTTAKLQSEIKHVLRLIKGIAPKPFCVYYDMEDSSTTKLGKAKLTEHALEFCKAMNVAGYRAGVYANQYWCKTHLNIKAIADAKHSIWCAKYSLFKPSIAASYDIWQYSSKGKVDGISGNVDMNTMYNQLYNIAPKPAKLSTKELADRIIAGEYGNGAARTARLKELGYTTAEIKAAQAEVNARYAKPTPPAETVVTYVVKKGDTLSSIAKKYGTTYKKIAADNGISNPNKIYVGQTLKIKK